MKQQRRFTKEFDRLVQTSGRTQRDIAGDLGIGLSTLVRWLGRSRDRRAAAPAMAAANDVKSFVSIPSRAREADACQHGFGCRALARLRRTCGSRNSPMRMANRGAPGLSALWGNPRSAQRAEASAPRTRVRLKTHEVSGGTACHRLDGEDVEPSQ
jgi:transposase-like protein